MFIELTEILFCPACRPDQGLVARVDRLEERRIVQGFLGCPSCEARYPVRQGIAHFAAAAWSGSGPGSLAETVAPGSLAETVAPESPLEPVAPGSAAENAVEPPSVLAALLGLAPDERGYVLLGPGLATAAPGLAGFARAAEIVVLGEPGALRAESSAAEAGRLSWLEGLDPGGLPFFPGRFRGIALAAGSPRTVVEAARRLEPRGRLVVLAPPEEVVQAVESGPLELVASEPRALVARRA